jgi:hypothetical protein
MPPIKFLSDNKASWSKMQGRDFAIFARGRLVIYMYSDGSKLADKRTGGGYVGYCASRQVVPGAFSLGSNKEVFDAEAEAGLSGAHFSTNLWIFLENLEVAARLLTPFAGSSQAVFYNFMELASAWPNRPRLPHIGPGSIQIRWVPGHPHQARHTPMPP